MSDDEELRSFKTRINLSEYVAAQGYRMDKKASSRNSIVMHHPDSDKIVIARGSDGHWVYFSVRADNDNGSIIDFVQNRRNVRLGGVRQELRPWIGQGTSPRRPPVQTYAPQLEPATKDRLAVLAAYERARPLTMHTYLEQERCIPVAVLASSRFAGKLRTDRHGNAIFAHHDQAGLCGYEIRGPKFKGFAKGGTKGLWFSIANKADTRLVITESAVNALSFHALHQIENTRYASIGGQMNPTQPELVRAAIAKMPPGAEIILASDADTAGRALADQIGQLAVDRNDITILKAQPPQEDTDWNDQLKTQARKPLPEPVSP